MKTLNSLYAMVALGALSGSVFTSVSFSTKFQTCNKIPALTHYSDDRPINEKLAGLPFYRFNNCTEILQSTQFPSKVTLTENGFIYTVLDAYNYHHNLILRPDDVWAAIMTQFSFYVNKNAEEFRGKFVNFEGKKELEVTVGGTLRSAPYDTLVKLMTERIHENLVDPQVKSWILPSFSTTTDNDLVTVGVVFMATVKKYFDFKFSLSCGIPHITLEGTVDDWKDVYGRLEKLKEYKLGKWYDMLEPILQQFVSAKQGKVDRDFWQRIAHYEPGGSGPSYISGWITAFAVFDKDGNWRESNFNRFSFSSDPNPADFTDVEKTWLRIDTDEIPPGVVEVDVKINDNGQEYNTTMTAGHIGKEIKSDEYTLQPLIGWAIALKS